jgi:hypothetical protein
MVALGLAADLNLQGGIPGLMVLLQASGEQGRSPLSVKRQRHDWVRRDVRCLMCGRLVGRLLGIPRTHENGYRSAGHAVAFLAYRAMDPSEPLVRFTPRLRFRCHQCGGTGALDEVDVFSTYDDALDVLQG